MARSGSNTLSIKEETIDEETDLFQETNLFQTKYLSDVTQETKGNLAQWNGQLIKEEWIDDVNMESKEEEGTQGNTDMAAEHIDNYCLCNVNIKEEPSYAIKTEIEESWLTLQKETSSSNQKMELMEAKQRIVKKSQNQFQEVHSKQGNHSQRARENTSKRNVVGHVDTLKNSLKKGVLLKLYECETCNYKCKFKHLLKNHIARVHEKQKNHFCNVCGHGFFLKGHLGIHQMTHSDEKPHACDECGKRFRRKDSLKLHLCPKEKALLEKSSLLSNNVLSCDFCNCRFTKTRILESHMRIHTKQLFTCYVCNYTSRKKNYLRLHVRLHLQDKKYCCSTCKRTYMSAKDLKRHEYRHKYKQTILMCDECAFTTRCSSSLRTHMKRKHTGEKPFSCQYCDYKCVKMGDLRRHETKHTGLKLFACDYCDYKSNRHDVLALHIRTHTGEKPYTCELCDYACAGLSNLKQHEFNNHINAKNKRRQ